GFDISGKYPIHREIERLRCGRALGSEAMASVVRILRVVGAVGVLAVVLLIGVGARPAAAAPEESISSYDTTIAVGEDGRMQVTETIAYDFGGNQRHGIFRKIPARFKYNDTHDRIYPIDDVKVTMDSGSVPVKRSSEGGDEVFKIGDPNK